VILIEAAWLRGHITEFDWDNSGFVVWVADGIKKGIETNCFSDRGNSPGATESIQHGHWIPSYI